MNQIAAGRRGLIASAGVWAGFMFIASIQVASDVPVNAWTITLSLVWLSLIYLAAAAASGSLLTGAWERRPFVVRFGAALLGGLFLRFAFAALALVMGDFTRFTADPALTTIALFVFGLTVPSRDIPEMLALQVLAEYVLPAIAILFVDWRYRRRRRPDASLANRTPLQPLG